MNEWLTPGIILAILGNVVTVAVIWGRMTANMSNLGDKMATLSGDVHDMRNTLVDLGRLATRIAEKVDGHERELTRLDRISGSHRLP